MRNSITKCRITFVLGDRNQIRERLQSRPGKGKNLVRSSIVLFKSFSK